MTNEQSYYLELAKQKFNQDKDTNWSANFTDFACECFVKLPPCSYGSRIAEYLRLELGAEKVSSRLGIGDILVSNTYYEVKVSFLSSISNKWSITHIRPWQKFNNFIFCFIDCENNFVPQFYVINRNSIHKFNTTPMNGTSKSNSENGNIEMRTDIEKGSDSHRQLIKLNLLKNTTLEELRSFINS